MKFILVALFLFLVMCNQGLSQTDLGRITSYSISGDQGSGYIGDLVVSAESAPRNVIALINAQGTTVSTDDITATQRVKLYPNPTVHEIIIDAEVEVRYYQVCNSLGQLILKGTERQIDASKLSRGRHHLSINGNSAVSFIKL